MKTRKPKINECYKTFLEFWAIENDSIPSEKTYNEVMKGPPFKALTGLLSICTGKNYENENKKTEK